MTVAEIFTGYASASLPLATSPSASWGSSMSRCMDAGMSSGRVHHADSQKMSLSVAVDGWTSLMMHDSSSSCFTVSRSHACTGIPQSSIATALKPGAPVEPRSRDHLLICSHNERVMKG